MLTANRVGLILPALLASLTLAATVRGIDGLEFLPPAGCLPGDGGPPFHVYVYAWETGAAKGVLTLQTNIGWLEEPDDLGDGLYRTYFQPPEVNDRAEITWSGEWKSPGKTIRGFFKARLCPNPSGVVEIRAQPDRLLAEKDRQATLAVRASDEDGKPVSGLPLEITTNVGRVGPLEDLGGGNYRAIFEAPDEPYPQVALITVANPIGARLDRVAAARTVIPIAARLELPGKTAPGVQMEMVIANQRFGPVVADANGQFRLPILVPPGFGTGEATSIDRAGNRETRSVNLYLPETNQLCLWAYPKRLPADGTTRSRLLVTTIDSYGFPTDLGKLLITAAAGAVGQTRQIARGLYEAYYTAPPTVGSGRVSLQVAFPEGGKKSRAEVDLRLRPGPANKATIQVPDGLPADGASAAVIVVEVADQRGNPIENELLTLRSSQGRLGTTKETVLGRYETALLVDPFPERWAADLSVEVKDRGGVTPRSFVISPESLQTTSAGDLLEAVLVDGDGLPVSGEKVEMTHCGPTQAGITDAFGRVQLRPAPSRGDAPVHCMLQARSGAIRKPLTFIPRGDHLRIVPIELDPFLPSNQIIHLEARIALRPPTEVIPEIVVVDTSRKGGPWLLRAKLTDATGQNPLRGRNVQFSVSVGRLGGAVREVAPGVYETELFPPAAGWHLIEVEAADSMTGVAAQEKIFVPGGKR